MFSSQTPLPPLGRQSQTPLQPLPRQPQTAVPAATPLFRALPPAAAAATAPSSDEEEAAPYHPDALAHQPQQQETPQQGPPPLDVGERLAPSSPQSEAQVHHHHPLESPAASGGAGAGPPSASAVNSVAPATHSMSTALVLSGNASPPAPSASGIVAQHHPVSPDVKTTENGSSGATTAEADAEAEDDKKREREHKKRSKNWTRPETLKLIRLRTELEPRFAKSGRKTELWDEIAEALQRERITRDAQQCRDKWEKLTAGYKEVRDGLKDREDNPFYDELHPLLSGKSLKREREREKDAFGSGKDTPGKDQLYNPKDLTRSGDFATAAGGVGDGFSARDLDKDGGAGLYNRGAAAVAAAATGGALAASGRGSSRGGESFKDEEDDGDEGEARAPARKKKRGSKYITVTDLAAVQSLLEAVIARQQRFFRDLLDSMERKEQLREQIRQEKEDKWRAEERAQRAIFNNAMIVLTQKLVGDRVGSAMLGAVGPLVGSPEGPQGPKRRSKNWKRAEVLQLIKLRGDMDARFAKSTRRAALWEELAELLAAQGIKRDGKQCREKWDKLMAEYKDVTDGKRDQSESPYFSELTAIIGRPAEAT